MKNNNLFRKFLALFLTGTMLAGVGCKDYDDDIDDINKKIDDLNAKVELKADASALQTISDKLKDVDFSKFVTDAELSQELAAYVKDADLEKKVGDLGFQTVTQVQDLIKGLQNEAQVKTLIENQLKAADLWSKIGGEVKKGILEELAKNSELTTAVKNQAVAAVLAAITNDPAVKDIKTAISKIAGEEASEFVKEYMDVNNKAWIENVNSAAAEAVKNAESALSRQIISLISTQGFLKKSDLTTELGAFKQAIAQLQADVAALINRIQSLVNVPGTMDFSYGEAYTTMDFYKVGATPIGNGMVTLTYRVTPASLAKDLVDAYANGKATFAIVSEQIKTRAATATPAAAITDVRFIEEGKFAVTATMSAEELGELYEKEGKWITLALSIENTVNPGTGAEDETASEVTNNVLSNFASIMPDEAQEIELGVYTKDEEPVAYDYATIEMPFNKQAVSKKTLLENTQLLASLDGGKTLMTLDNVNKLLGSKISIGAYTVTPKYYADASQSAEITDKTEIAGVKTTVVEGLVNGTTNLWEWPNITLPTYFNEVDAEKYDFTFEVTSKDDKPNKGDKYAVVNGDKLDWSAANRNYVDIKAVVKIKGTNIQVASQPLRVEIQTPIKTLAQTKAIEVAYKTNEATTANMFENLQLIDADGKSWIEYNKDTKAWEAVTVGDGKTAYDVFQAKPEAAKNTAGIVFKMKSAEYADTPASDKDASAYIKITDNTLTYENNSATLLKDIIIKVTPSFTYQYGEITGEEMTITIKR